jgi:hypothetical protein
VGRTNWARCSRSPRPALAGPVYVRYTASAALTVPVIGGLVIDSAGNLFDTTYHGGIYYPNQNWGTVFKLINGGGGRYGFNSLYSFKPAPPGYVGGKGIGAWPTALVFDSNGDIWGTTAFAYGNLDIDTGTIFVIRKIGSGYGIPTTVYNLSQYDGENPVGHLAIWKDEILFGTVYAGTTNGYGAVWGSLSMAGSGYCRLSGYRLIIPLPSTARMVEIRGAV